MYIKTETQDAVEVITIDRQQALNALNPEVLEFHAISFPSNMDWHTCSCIQYSTDHSEWEGIA